MLSFPFVVVVGKVRRSSVYFVKCRERMACPYGTHSLPSLPLSTSALMLQTTGTISLFYMMEFYIHAAQASLDTAVEEQQYTPSSLCTKSSNYPYNVGSPNRCVGTMHMFRIVYLEAIAASVLQRVLRRWTAASSIWSDNMSYGIQQYSEQNSTRNMFMQPKVYIEVWVESLSPTILLW